MEIAHSLINAMSQVLPRSTARSIFEKSLLGSNPNPTPQEWIAIIKGPLQDELRALLPIRGSFRPFETILNVLKEQIQEKPQFSPLKTIEVFIATEYINMGDAAQVEGLALDLARMDDVLGVMIEGKHSKEARMMGFSELSTDIMKMANFLLSKRTPYSIYYAIWSTAQVVIRPLEGGWVAVVGSKDANLGQLLYRLSHLEGEPTH